MMSSGNHKSHTCKFKKKKKKSECRSGCGEKSTCRTMTTTKPLSNQYAVRTWPFLADSSFMAHALWKLRDSAAAGGFVCKGEQNPSRLFHSEQRGAEGRDFWPVRGVLPLRRSRLVVRGVGAAVYVAIGLEALLGCSHHVWRFHCGSANRERQNECVIWAHGSSFCCDIQQKQGRQNCSMWTWWLPRLKAQSKNDWVKWRRTQVPTVKEVGFVVFCGNTVSYCYPTQHTYLIHTAASSL